MSDIIPSVPLPIGYYRPASGDTLPDLGDGTEARPWIMLDLHPDGSVTWRKVLAS